MASSPKLSQPKLSPVLENPSLPDLAKQGDAGAIAVLINRALKPKGMMAKVRRDRDNLRIVVKGDPLPPRSLVASIRKGLSNLEVSAIQRVTVYGQKQDEEKPQWREEFEWGPAPSSPTPVPVQTPVLASMPQETVPMIDEAMLEVPMINEAMLEDPIIDEAIVGVGRSGKLLVMRPTAKLPQRCVKTNGPVDGKPRKVKLVWYPPYITLILVLVIFNIPLLLALVVYLIVASTVTKRATIEVWASQPVLAKQSQAASNTWLLGSLGLVLLFFGVSGKPVFMTVVGVLCLGGSLLLALTTGLVTPQRITKDEIWLKGFGEDYLAALPEWGSGVAQGKGAPKSAKGQKASPGKFSSGPSSPPRPVRYSTVAGLVVIILAGLWFGAHLLFLQQAAVYNNEGMAFERQKNYGRAIAEFNQAISFNPNLAEAYSNRGLAYERQGNYSQAIADCNQAISLNPNLAEAYSNRGLVYERQGNYSQAIADFNQAISLNPNLAEAYSNRGLAYERQGNYSQAIADCNQAISLNPNFAPAYNNRGAAYNDQDNYKQAILDLTKAINLDPDQAEAYSNRGVAYANQGNYSQAILDLTQAIKLNPELAYAYNNRGSAYANQKNYSQAISDLNQAIILKPNDALIYNNRGFLYYQQGNYNEAILDLDQAIKLNPKYAVAYYGRGLIYYKQGSYSQARSDYNQALNLDPKHTKPYYGR